MRAKKKRCVQAKSRNSPDPVARAIENADSLDMQVLLSMGLDLAFFLGLGNQSHKFFPRPSDNRNARGRDFEIVALLSNVEIQCKIIWETSTRPQAQLLRQSGLYVLLEVELQPHNFSWGRSTFEELTKNNGRKEQLSREGRKRQTTSLSCTRRCFSNDMHTKTYTLTTKLNYWGEKTHESSCCLLRECVVEPCVILSRRTRTASAHFRTNSNFRNSIHERFVPSDNRNARGCYFEIVRDGKGLRDCTQNAGRAGGDECRSGRPGSISRRSSCNRESLSSCTPTTSRKFVRVPKL